VGTLYLVSTPIGNLEDMTLRGLRVLREAALIAAEDTRHTRKLLSRYDIETPCIAYHEHNKLTRLDAILDTLASGDVALVSDAGTPTLSDPGYELVQACIAAGITVAPVPGANAPLAALAASGLPTDRFSYLGFLPRRTQERRALFASVATLPATLVCFETPHRLRDALADALHALGDRQIAVGRELTKLHEEFVRLPLSAAIEHFTQHAPRGEFTLVIAGASRNSQDTAPADDSTVLARLHALHAAGHSSSAAARMVAKETGRPRSEVYNLWLTRRESDDEAMS
jgi:16S rRNA (cytidine1402-2'-O)-methyltransferase